MARRSNIRRLPIDGDYRAFVISRLRTDLYHQLKLSAAALNMTLECIVNDALGYGLAYMARELMPHNVVKMAEKLREREAAKLAQTAAANGETED